MALDLAGIGNVGEFFSQHYLDALLERDLKDTLARWKKRKDEEKQQTPAERLARLAEPYFRLASRAEGLQSAAARLELAQGFHADLLGALGYERKPNSVLLDNDHLLPVLYAEQQNHKPWLWIVEAPFAINSDDSDPFGESPIPEQAPAVADSETSIPLATGTWRELFDDAIFRAEEPPRWVIFVAGGDVFLLDRDKWHRGKYLHFQLGRLLSLREPKALQATTGLLHREVLLPEGGQSLLEKLDEESHKHAFAVSTDLKFGAQKAIELLGNEAVRYRLEVQKKKTYDDELDVRELTRECITYLYRLLFLFYVEARSTELHVVPMNSDTFRLGYSLENLRDLELVALTTDEARNGTYLSDSLRRLFHLVQRGHSPGRAQAELDFTPNAATVSAADSEPQHATFSLRGLRSPLFDEERTPILRAVKFRNQVMQQVLQLLSLSKEGKGRARGRISYAQLGINQLGAVYEGLLSYTGFFASEELFEVRDAKEIDDEGARTYFVPASKVDSFKKEELVKDEFKRPLKHPKGTFLFRLAGRDRERSASYYTPEVLTRCLTKYTLKVRLGEPLLPEDDTPELRAQRVSADEMLNLTLCEPAMGSGAFLNEAVSQLAEKYLEKKQQELRQTIPAEHYQAELAKVKYHFVVHNTYGVDLNPLATELGKISLWLNVLQEKVEAPYLDQRLSVGNSLIGARREVFPVHLLTARGAGNDTWLTSVPERIPLRDSAAAPGEDLRFPARPANTVYHFLLPDSGMVAYADDDVVKDLRAEQAEALRTWRKQQLSPFTEAQVARLVTLSDRIDALWQAWADERISRKRALRQPIHLWGQPTDEQRKAGGRQPDTKPRFRSVEEAEELVRTRDAKSQSGPSLKLVMDYWCALWFWPVLDAHLAPTRDEWLNDVEAILEGGAATMQPPSQKAAVSEPGLADRLAVVRRVAAEQRFFHWQLAFAEVFALRGGMDVFLGNPPWVKVEWQESGVLGDMDPLLNLRRLSAKQTTDHRVDLLTSDDHATQFLHELSTTRGQGAFIAGATNYPLLRGVQGNLYKAFLEQTWRALSPAGSVGLWHQPGLFEDPGGGALRREFYLRGAMALRFKNELLLFADIANQRSYMATVSRGTRASHPLFISLSNLLHPRTIDDSLADDGRESIPGIKTDAGDWDLRGHRSRALAIDERSLAVFSQMYDVEGTPVLEARLPAAHSVELIDVLERISTGPERLIRRSDRWFSVYDHLDESRQQKDGTIRRETTFPPSAAEWIVSGPQFFVGNPFNKTPNAVCNHNKDYSSIDLTTTEERYLPRTNYLPACSPSEYARRTPTWNNSLVTSMYRHAHREMVSPTSERTLISCIIPPGAAHIHSVFSIAFASSAELLEFSALSCSLPVDFIVRSTGAGHVNRALSSQLPCSFGKHERSSARHRALRLNCLTTHYADLWQEVATKDIAKDGFAKQDPRLPSWQHLTPKWTRDSALRTPYERRQALVELDALAALSLGLTVEQLQLIYRVQFPVLQQYERETYYDQRGKIVFTTNRGLSGVGLDRKQWEEVQHAQAGDKLPAWAKDAGGPFIPPFDFCDRELDMAQAYRHFQEKLALHAVDDLPTIIPNVSDTDYAKLFVWALLHVSGGTATRLDLARAFALRAAPNLVKRLAPTSDIREVRHWVSTVGSRSMKTGLLRSTLSELADRGGVLPGANREGRATVSTSPHTAAREKIDPWIRFEADLVMRVLRAQPEERRTAIDESLPDADRTFLENVG